MAGTNGTIVTFTSGDAIAGNTHVSSGLILQPGKNYGTNTSTITFNTRTAVGATNVAGTVQTVLSLDQAKLATFKGRIITDDVTEATTTADGSLQTDGGLSVAKDAVIGNDLKLLSDAAVLSLGADSDATLTHDNTTGLTIAATPISIDSTGSLDLSSTTGDINFQDGGVDQLSLDMDGTAGEIIMQLKVDSDDFVFKQYDGTEVFRVEDNGSLQIGTTGGLNISNSSNDMILKPMTDAKDIIFQQYDGRNILEINDAGYVAIGNGSTGPGELRIYEDTDNGTNYTAFKVGTQSGNITYTLPTADGSDGHQLTTDGSGNLSWAAAGSGGGGGGGSVSGDTFASDLKIGRDADNLIAFATTDNKVIFRVNGVNEVELVENAMSPVTNGGMALGTTSLGWSNLYLSPNSAVTSAATNATSGWMVKLGGDGGGR